MPENVKTEIGHFVLDDDEPETCDRCGGDGEVVVCCDDMCVGLGECIHGDGMAVCPDCRGRGTI